MARERLSDEERSARKREWNARYYAENQEKVREKHAAYRAANLEKIRRGRAENPEKDRERAAIWRAENPEKAAAYKATYRAENKQELLVRGAVRRGKAKGMEHTITVDDLHWPTHCPVLGIELNYEATGRAKSNSPSLDRWNNEVGYTPRNTVVISMRANALKRDGTLEELQRVVYYAKFGRNLPPIGLEDVWGD